MSLKPGIVLNEQYQKLKDIVLSAEHFQWSDSEPYLGPVRPAGITLQLNSYLHLLNCWFILAERVTPEHLGDVWDEESPFGIISLALDNNLEFRDWDPASKTFTRIYGSSGNDGTMWGDCKYYANLNKHMSLAVLVYEQNGTIYSGHMAPRLWPN